MVIKYFRPKGQGIKPQEIIKPYAYELTGDQFPIPASVFNSDTL